MADEAPKTGPNLVRSPAFREIYSNIINARMNLFDCGMTFSYVTSQAGSLALDTIVEEVHVTMAYGGAKFLIGALSRIVDAYEAEFGPVAAQEFLPESDELVRHTVEALKANNLKSGTPKV